MAAAGTVYGASPGCKESKKLSVCSPKASITLSGNLLKVVDSLAGAAQRSAWIERAVQSYAARQLKERRRERELVLLNRHADALNTEGDDSATYQANWTAE